LIERWNGDIWTIASSPHVGGFTHLGGVAAADPSQAWAVGDHVVVAQRTRVLVERFIGGSWSVVPVPSPGPGTSELDGVAAVSDDDVWSVGFRTRRLGPPGFGAHEALAEHWDGSAWTIVPTPRVPSGDTRLVSVAAVGANDVWAVGFDTMNSRGRRPLAEHWDGTAWSVVPTPNPGGPSGFASVAARGTDDVWAVGYKNPAEAPIAEHWDGSRWSFVDVGHAGRNAVLTGVSATPADVFAAGATQYHALVERWNGAAFERVDVPRSRDGNLGSLGTDGSTTWGVGFRAGGKRPLIEYVC